MSKKVDNNGYWYIKHNPISKEGVFPYLGHTISEECEPNKIYKVYRPAKTLEESVETWDNPPKPFIDDHEMLGEGFTAIDDRPVQGIIYNPEFKDGVLYADIAVYSEDLKANIENGKKELSLGYFCKYKKERGVFKGEVYDYIQYDMVGNHIALVDAGRCGSDVKVFDHKCTMDSLDLGENFEKEIPLKKDEESATIDSKEQKEEKMADKREFIRKIMAIAAKADSDFEGGESEKIETIAKLLEESEYAKSERGTANDESEEEEKKTEDKCGKDEEEEKKSEDSDEEEEKKSTEDSLKELMSVVKDMADDVKKLVAEKAQDEDEKEEKESEDESEEEEKEEKAEDSDDDEEKKSEDSAIFVFGADSAVDADEALTEYLK